MSEPGGELWIFGYGSLMWRPGFPFDDAVPARLEGWRRSFCIYSTHHRGTAARPGLVLGLDRGGACDGMAYRVPASAQQATLSYLRAREQINGVYREASIEVTARGACDLVGRARIGAAAAGDRRSMRALTFVVERAHPSYAGDLPLATQAGLIRGARGISGANVDYLVNTLAHLDQLGIAEPRLARLLVQIGGYFQHRECDGSAMARARCQTLMQACRWYQVPVRRMHKGERRRFVHRLQIDAQRRPGLAGGGRPGRG